MAEKTEELLQIDDTFDKENVTKKTLLKRYNDLEGMKKSKLEELSLLKSKLLKHSMEPARICRQADATEKAVMAMTDQMNGVKRKTMYADTELEKCHQRREATAKLKTSILEKNEIHRLTIEKRDKDVASILKNLEDEKSLLHDNITMKMELNLRRKEIDSDYRHMTETLNFLKKDYDGVKRQYKKKRSKADAVRQLIPTLSEQLVDEQHNVGLYCSDRDENRRRNEKLKDEIDVALAHFLEQEGLEKSKKEVRVGGLVLGVCGCLWVCLWMFAWVFVCVWVCGFVCVYRICFCLSVCVYMCLCVLVCVTYSS
jgi:hypothetical protein